MGSLGLGQQVIDYVEKPEPIEALKGFSITRVACGDFHSLAQTHRGHMFAWGDNSYGQLGVGGCPSGGHASENRGTRGKKALCNYLRILSCMHRWYAY